MVQEWLVLKSYIEFMFLFYMCINCWLFVYADQGLFQGTSNNKYYVEEFVNTGNITLFQQFDCTLMSQRVGQTALLILVIIIVGLWMTLGSVSSNCSLSPQFPWKEYSESEPWFGWSCFQSEEYIDIQCICLLSGEVTSKIW